MPVLGIIAVVLVLIAVGVFAWRHEQARREALLAWAHGKGWRLDGSSRRGWHEAYPGLKVFDRGRSRVGKNVVTGEVDGLAVTCLDYKFVTGSGKNRTTHNRGVVILACGFPTIPLLIRREHALDRVGEFLGADDIDFESREFSRKFYVKSGDKRWAYDIVHARTMEYLLTAPSFTVEFGFGEIAVYRTGRNSPAQHEEALGVARKLHALIPDYVVAQMKGGPA